MYAAGEQAAVSFCNGLKGLLRIRAPALPEPATAGATAGRRCGAATG